MAECRAIEILTARFPADAPDVHALFREYMDSLRIDLSFQDVEHELATLPGRYAGPQGVILIARDSMRTAVGCVALRPQATPLCSEMKRLYVRAPARGQDLGRRLVLEALAYARSQGHARVVLDTLASMQAAQRLYRELGFRDVAPYYANPLPGTRYLALDLA